MAISRKQFSIEVGGKTLTLETSSLAGRTNAAILGKYGETAVLVSVVMSREDRAVDYVPLKVDYEERFYAAGKIIGSRFIRREGRPSEEAVLTGRLIDRTIRPLFDYHLRREVQVVVTVLAYDEENDPDFVGLIAASTAIGISDVPWGGPVAGIRVAKAGGAMTVNPMNSEFRNKEGNEVSFETFFAGPQGSINMIELGGNEAAEKDVLQALARGQKEIDRLIEFQHTIIKEIGKEKVEIHKEEVDPRVANAVETFLNGRLEQALYHAQEARPGEALSTLKEELFSHLTNEIMPALEKESDGEAGLTGVDALFEETIDRLVRRNILEKEKRPDGRALDEVRALEAETGLFERTHGSGLFIRGNTQALVVTTLASPGAEQLIETMEVTGKRGFMLHYNFPSYSVGEIGSFRGPGRREIGHGALAEKALKPMIPAKDDFPYTIRVVSEILSSNGSSSMATVCAASLSLMDAGVPIKKATAGIAMGLMMDEQGAYKIVTDIQGPEDHHGDMDLKVAGTKDGINAVQMDTKVRGLTLEILEKSLAQAKKARLEILNVMDGALATHRAHISPHAPTIIQLKINPEKIGLVIGPGGKMINGLIKRTGVASIDIEEDGRIYIAAQDPAKAKEAADEIKLLGREFKVGEVIEGTVVRILDFGAIVDLGGGQDGMVHVSELKDSYVKNVRDVVKEGDRVRTKVIRVDPDGHIGLSIKQLTKE